MAEKTKVNGKWVYDDDDGRTIVDMSGVERRNLLIPRFPKGDEPSEPKEAFAGDEAPRQDRPWEDRSLSKSETRSFIFGTLSAGLLLVLIFILGGAALIGLILLIGK